MSFIVVAILTVEKTSIIDRADAESLAHLYKLSIFIE